MRNPITLMGALLLAATAGAQAPLVPVFFSPQDMSFTPLKGRELISDGTAVIVGETCTQPCIERSWNLVEPGGRRVTQQTQRWYILSDGPEGIGLHTWPDGTSEGNCPANQCLANDGYYFMRARRSGLGQVFSYHANFTNTPLVHAILVANPGQSTLRVSATRAGYIPVPAAPVPPTDMTRLSHLQWEEYFDRPRFTSLLVPAGESRVILKQDVPADLGLLFSITAELEFTQLDGLQPAEAVVVDLAWPAGSAFQPLDWSTQGSLAEELGCCGRGAGHSYQPEIKLNTFVGTDGVISHREAAPYQTYLLGGDCTDFSGDDTTVILKKPYPDGHEVDFPSSLYGRILDVRWPLQNLSSTPRRFRIAASAVCPHVLRGPNQVPVVVQYSLSVRYPSGNLIHIDKLFRPLHFDGSVPRDGVSRFVPFYEAVLAPGEVWDASFQVLVDGPGEGKIGLTAYEEPL